MSPRRGRTGRCRRWAAPLAGLAVACSADYPAAPKPAAEAGPVDLGCGDGHVREREECDRGELNGPGSGCETDCTFSCHVDDECEDGNPCNGDGSCVAVLGGRLCESGPAEPDGTPCGESPRRICVSASCSPSTCGDGVVDPDEGEECEPPGSSGCDATCVASVCGDGVAEGAEECDEGNGNGRGTGCETDCTFSCHSDTDCDDGEPCNGGETCAAAGGGMGCTSGTAVADGDPCGGGDGYCDAGVCTSPICGNGRLEPGEECEPPGLAACSEDCLRVECGDGRVTGSEECDDGDADDFDGCDGACRYEVVLRTTLLEMVKDAPPSWCVHAGNRFGSAISQITVDEMNRLFQDEIDQGSLNMMWRLTNLDDLTGQIDPALGNVFLAAQSDPRDPAPWTPAGLDHWFVGELASIGGFAPGSLSAGILSLGPLDTPVPMRLGALDLPFYMRDLKLRLLVDDSPPPDVPAPSPDVVSPDLAVFRTISGTGKDFGMCGVLVVDSMARIPTPMALTTGVNECNPTCNESHSYVFCGSDQPVGPSCHSLLDLAVGGCKSGPLCVPVVTPAQPDVGTSTLTLDPVTGKVPPAQYDGNLDGYTSYFRLRAGRAHLTNRL